jgi:hypothetical protein
VGKFFLCIYKNCVVLIGKGKDGCMHKIMILFEKGDTKWT